MARKKLTDEERDTLISALVDNELVTNEEAEGLESLTDASLVRFSEATINSVEDDDDAEDDDDEEGDDDIDGGDGDDEEDEEPTGNSNTECTCNKCSADKKKKKGASEMATNARRPQSAEDWMNDAPPEVQEVVANAMEVIEDQKTELIEGLTKHLTGTERAAMVKSLATNSLKELKNIAKLIPKQQEAPVQTQNRRFNFGGASTPTGNSSKKKATEQADLLIPPVMNWSEVVKDLNNAQN